MPRPKPGTSAAFLARFGLLALALAGAALLIVAEFSTLYEIKVITVVKETSTAGAHHGYALLVIGLAAAVFAVGATLGSSRPAGFALLALALAALAVTLLVDYPDVESEGLIGRNYEQAVASPQTGFYLETLGSVLLLLAAVSVLVFGPRSAAAEAARERESRDASGSGAPATS